MLDKLNFSFNSKALVAYFLISALGFSVLLIVILRTTTKAERLESIHDDVALIVNGITGSILNNSDVESQGLAFQTQSAMQEYLNLTFENSKIRSLDPILRVSVFFLNPEKQLIGDWIATDQAAIPHSCIEPYSKFFQPPKSHYSYLIELEINNCADTNLSLFEMHSLSMPIYVSFGVILIWGICIFAMLRSVSYASKLLVSSAHTAELINNVEKIRWIDVNLLTQKALQVRGHNLQFYQTLVLDAQHDVCKILDLIVRKFGNPELNQNINVIQNIMQKIAIEVRSSDEPYKDITGHRELTAHEFKKMVNSFFSGCDIKITIPDNLNLSIIDISLFERILVNLASNATKHSIARPKVYVSYKEPLLQLLIKSQVNYVTSWFLFFAKLTKRIDTENHNTPVYMKIFGRTGRGFAIVKRGIIKFGGKIIFSIQGNRVSTGFYLPTYKTKIIEPDKEIFLQKRKAIYFSNPEFSQLAVDQGLKKFMITESEFNDILNKKNNEKIELVTDLELEPSEHYTIRLVQKKGRIEGLALNWLGGQENSKEST